MTNPTNPPSGNPVSGKQNASAAGAVRDITIGGNFEGNFIVGDGNTIYEGDVNTYYGDVLKYSGEPVIRRNDENPQPPRPPRGFVGRSSELNILEQVIADKDTAFIYGHDGLGKTDLVNQVANSDLAGNMANGVVRIESIDGAGRALGFDDVIQSLFDTFFYSMPPLKVDLATAKVHLNSIAPLVVLDGFDFPATAFDQFPNLIRNGALLVTHQDLNTDQDIYKPVELAPLVRQDAVQLLAGRSGIPVVANNEAVMDRICELCGDVPLAITKLAKTILRKRLDLVDIRDTLESLYPPSSEPIQAAIERSFGAIYPQLSEAERQALLLVAAAPGISVDRTWLESVAQDSYAVAELEMMELIQANSPRMRLAPGLRQILYTGQNTWQTQRSVLLRYILREIQSRSLDFEFINDELGNILGLIEWAAGENRWNDVITLGRAVDPYLTLHRFWDAWANVLQWVLTAGRTLADKVTQAWALHQLGTREIGVGTRDQARDYLIRALRIRESLGDEVGAAYTRHNLNLILPPPGSNGKDSKPDNPIKDFIQKWIIGPWKKLIERSPIIPWLIPALIATIAVIAIFFFRPPSNNCPMPGGWREYRVQKGDTIDSISQRVASAVDGEIPLIRMAILEANFYCKEIEIPSILKPRQILYVPADPVKLTILPTEVPLTPPVPGRSSEISLALSRDPDDSAEVNQAGQVINYVYDISHIGKEPLTGQLSLEDRQGNEIACPEFKAVGNRDDAFNPEEIVTCTASYRVTQADINNRSIVNAATASIGETVSNEDTLTIDIVQEFGLEITKEARPEIYYQVGQEITYAYTIRNSGNVTLGPVQLFVIDDHINGGEAGFLCEPEVTTLAPEETVTCTAAYNITQADIEAGSVTNQARVKVSVAGFALFERKTASIVGIQPATATVTYVQPPTLEKTASLTEFDNIDQEIRYTYNVTNINKVPITGPITVKDYLISDENTKKELTVNCPQIEVLSPEEPATCSASYLTTQADLDIGFVTNEATATVSDLISKPDSVTVKAIQKPKLELTKTADPTTYNQVGQSITYTYTIKNVGNITLGPAQFKISDDRVDNNIPFNCGPDSTELARAETLTCSASYRVSPADLDVRSVTNTATASVIMNGKEVVSKPASTQVSCTYPPGSPWRIYTILSGDTLSKISSWYRNTTVDDLMQNNCLSSTNLYTGQSLYVPGPPPLATITGTIFSDPNRNGQMDTQQGEGPVQNATVNLLDAATKVIIASYTTGTNGAYSFRGLNPGVYQIFQAQIVVSSRPGEVLVKDFGISPVP